ncbi:hypothetical protein Hypma_007667 [Hypsizygus marmoreus]|uniref:Uncharacterized protein n=1 Tax=Hypsizygus marmoreus TaxID=39966 RepID=A0A369JU47_HYPMA|nr:hypothetical protein Hypma_007667 [Hypsizygus marmoreus]
MSHSTTATSTYVLAKYSKSYPTALQSQQGNPEPSSAEWQHFINPVIRLVLDVKKCTDLESVRLRIIWLMDSDDEREEDIDLLSLSCLPQRRTPNQPAQGLPLKAVHRDSVVGIRYLHPTDTIGAPIYRRFQITFLSPLDVSQFIDAISTVCPCKANPSTMRVPRPMNPPMSAPTTTNLPPNRGGTLAPPASLPLPAQKSSDLQTPMSSSRSISVLPSSIYSSSPSCTEANDLRLSTSSQSPIEHRLPLPSAPGNLVNKLDSTSNHPKGSSQHWLRPTVQDIQKQTSLPDSSPPTSSGKSTSNDNNALRHDETTAALLASLRETTALYDLDRASLEQLLGEVVREDGFLKLLEHIDSMWRVKSFVGI